VLANLEGNQFTAEQLGDLVQTVLIAEVGVRRAVKLLWPISGFRVIYPQITEFTVVCS
jgi:hypothetical protein